MNVNGVIGVDANCFMLKRELAVEHAAIWHRKFRESGKPNPDLELANRLLRSGAIPASNRKHSVNYAVGATEKSVRADYFEKGNAAERDPAPIDKSLVRELYDRHAILVHFQPGARDILHFMPPFIVREEQIDKLIAALDEILSRGIGDATVRFVAKNIKRVFRDII
jgi:hypothetical protein